MAIPGSSAKENRSVGDEGGSWPVFHFVRRTLSEQCFQPVVTVNAKSLSSRGSVIISRSELEDLVVLATSVPSEALLTVRSLEAFQVTQSEFWLVKFAEGLAFRSQFKLEHAGECFGEALNAIQVDDPEAAKATERILVSRAGNHALRGSINSALQDLDAAAVNGASPHVTHQRAAVLAMAGRVSEAMKFQSSALRAFRKAGDPLWLARALQNRSKIAVLAGRIGVGIADATEAVLVYRSIGHDAGAAKSLHNLAALEGLSGRFSEAIRLFDVADGAMIAIGIPTEPGTEAKIEAFMQAGLFGDAYRLAGEVQQHAHHSGAGQLEAECMLLGARAAAALGQPEQAVHLATSSAGLFGMQGREGFVLMARLVQAYVDETSADLEKLTDDLCRAGWRDRAVQLTSWAIASAFLDGKQRPALRTPRHDRATTETKIVDAIELFENAEYASTLRNCDRVGRRIEGSLIVGYDHRIAIRRQFATVAAIAIRAALLQNDSAGAWAWSERTVESFSSSRAVVTSTELTSAIRGVDLELERSLAKGDLVAVEGYRAHQQTLLRRVNQVPRLRTRCPRPPVALGDIQRLLHDTTMVKFHRHGSQLSCFVVTSEAVEIVELGWTMISRLIDRMHREILRQVTTRQTRKWDRLIDQRESVNDAFGDVFARLRSTGPVVLTADAPMSQWPWAFVPLLEDRRFSVCSSAALWKQRSDAEQWVPTDSSQVSVIVGPSLSGAATESREIAKVWGKAGCYSSVTSRKLENLLAASDIVHIAAHGRTRSDNPEFSAIVVDPVPITMSQIERFARIAPMIVLGSCEAGAASNGHMSIGERLVETGARSVIAPILAVNDQTTSAVMVELHRQLHASHGPSEGLLRTRRHFGDTHSDEWLHARSLQCFGAM